MRALAALCALLALLCCPSVARAQQPEEMPSTLVLGFNPAENAQTLQRAADEVASRLSDRLHIPVRASVTLDYTTLVESMRAGHVHVGWLTPSPLVLAERLFGPKSDLRKSWYLERSGESLTVGGPA